MMRYSVQSRDWIFVKGYGFFSLLLKICVKKTWVVNVAKNVLIMLNNLQQIELKLLQKSNSKKQ